MSQLGQERHFGGPNLMSVLPPLATGKVTCRAVAMCHKATSQLFGHFVGYGENEGDIVPRFRRGCYSISPAASGGYRTFRVRLTVVSHRRLLEYITLICLIAACEVSVFQEVIS
jgi:hypothetical protein